METQLTSRDLADCSVLVLSDIKLMCVRGLVGAENGAQTINWPGGYLKKPTDCLQRPS